jgi:hypothetical protein
MQTVCEHLGSLGSIQKLRRVVSKVTPSAGLGFACAPFRVLLALTGFAMGETNRVRTMSLIDLARGLL